MEHGSYREITLDEAKALVPADHGAVIALVPFGSFMNNLDHSESDRDLAIIVEHTKGNSPQTVKIFKDDDAVLYPALNLGSTVSLGEGLVAPGAVKIDWSHPLAPYVDSALTFSIYHWIRTARGAAKMCAEQAAKRFAKGDLDGANKQAGRALKGLFREIKAIQFLYNETDSLRFTETEREEFFNLQDNLLDNLSADPEEMIEHIRSLRANLR